MNTNGFPIDINFDVSVDFNSYKQVSDQVVESYTKFVKFLGGDQNRAKRFAERSEEFINLFERELGREIMRIAVGITRDLIDATGGSTGNMASAWKVSVSKPHQPDIGMYNNNGALYLNAWMNYKASMTNEGVIRGRKVAHGRLNAIDGSVAEAKLLSPTQSVYTIHISNYALMEEYPENTVHTVQPNGYYTLSAIYAENGIVKSTMSEPADYAKERFYAEFVFALRRVERKIESMGIR